MVAREEAKHLLRRTEFIPRPGRIDALLPLTRSQAVDNILNVWTTDVPIPTKLTHHDEGAANYVQYQLAVHWWFDRMANKSPRPIQEKMALFWHGHFCSEWRKVANTPAMMRQNKLFRDKGTTGNLRELVRAMSIQPAMLLYLDNANNTASSPNQNFARELLELFLLGVGNYTEHEIESCTRAWTGHNINWTTKRYEFNAHHHASGRKTIFDRTAAFDGPGRVGPGVIDLVLGPNGRITTGPNRGQPTRRVAARFLSKKLWEAFAYQNPTSAIVNSLADTLIANNFWIKPWLKAMLMRDEFYSTKARTGLVRSPAEYVATVLAQTGLKASLVHPEWYGDEMGQGLFHPPDVSGWKLNRYWVNTSALAARAAFAQRVRFELTDHNEMSRPFRMKYGSWSWDGLEAKSPGELIDTMAKAFGLSLTTKTRNSLVAWSRREVVPSGHVDWWRSPNAILLMMLVPEMHVA